MALRADGVVVGLLRVRPAVVRGVLERERADAVPPCHRVGRHHDIHAEKVHRMYLRLHPGPARSY